ncbi:iron ABC transporter permease [Citricoccus sp.]|uniref:FecCD family ABC transporter permease n=1 Tax=Citricoccus sp. TaxID=1978372 RepID=UPI0028BE9EE1|nr:iron ABC transporter permease [Citricoccus sp.]
MTGVVLLVLLLAVLVLSAGAGQFPTTPAEVLGSVWRAVTGTTAAHPDESLLDSTLWNIRFPRLLLGVIVGAALGVAGALMQGVFSNPLAEPGIIGVSSGAAVGACVVIVFGLTAAGGWVLPLAAFLGGLVVTWLVYLLATSGNRAMVLTLVLTGIAVNAVAGAVMSFLVFLGDTASREQIVFWQMGSLNGATWTAVGTAGTVFLLGVVVAMALRGQLDLLSLGERPAHHAGVNVGLLRVVSIIAVAVLTSAAVAYAGLISFVGLVVPHALRLVIGPSHRGLIPLSALGGAMLLSLADVAARTVIPFADMPIGIFTAVVGGPVFFILLRQSLKRQGTL